MWIAKQRVLTACGWIEAGRIVADGDPMLAGCEDAFARVHDEAPAVEEATAVPGERRTARRRP